MINLNAKRSRVEDLGDLPVGTRLVIIESNIRLGPYKVGDELMIDRRRNSDETYLKDSRGRTYWHHNRARDGYIYWGGNTRDKMMLEIL